MVSPNTVSQRANIEARRRASAARALASAIASPAGMPSCIATRTNGRGVWGKDADSVGLAGTVLDMLLVLIHVNVVVNKKSTDAARHGHRLLGIDGLFALLGVCLRWRISYCCASA